AAVFEAAESGEQRAENQTATANPSKPQPSTLNSQPFERLTYDSAFERYLGTRVLDLPTSELPRLAEKHGVVPPPSLADDDRDGWLNLLLAERVEPNLGRERPTFLYDYPASQCALARVRPATAASPAVAERF